MEQLRSTEASLAYATTTRPPPRDISKVQYYNCKKYGHFANQCKAKICWYCKAIGHVIEECKGRNSTTRNYTPSAPSTSMVQSAHSAYTATSHQYAMSDFNGSLQYDSSSQPGFSSQFASPVHLSPDMVNQMILNALASMNISSTDSSMSHTWYLDSRASNHMTSSPTNLQNVVPYTDTLTVQTANGDHLPITSVGDISGPLPLTNVLVSPYLATNLISVGQLV